MGKVALVTGGTRGIGAAVSIGLKAAGYTVAASFAGNVEKAKAFQAETGIPVFQWDVGDGEGCATGVRTVETALGAIDILVNNAGITRDGWFHKMEPEQWSSVMRTNLDSMFLMTRPVIEGMRDRGFGRIINISSINAQKGQLGQVNYATAKAGVIGFTKALALENARKGITVNCICPGYIDTDMVMAVPPKVMEGILGQIPVGRLGKSEEIAALVS
jgi:acetoacetyl-CoA reductase